MNVASLQLEGLMMAVAAINTTLVRKGILSVEEVETALQRVEAGITGEDRVRGEISPANRDAICFPIRLLRLANQCHADTDMPPFSELTRNVGRSKPHYNDQM
jgi:hypothetical protein